MDNGPMAADTGHAVDGGQGIASTVESTIESTIESSIESRIESRIESSIDINSNNVDPSDAPFSDATPADVDNQSNYNLDPSSQQPADSEHINYSQNSQASHNSMFSSQHSNPDEDLDERDENELDDTPACSQDDHVTINPGCYHRDETIFDSEAFPFQEARVWDENGHLVAARDDYRMLYSQSKMLSCTQNRTKNPVYGISWSLVFMHSGMGLPEGLIKAIYFFHTIELLSHHHNWNGFVTSTNNLSENLYPKFAPDGKEKNIIGVVSKSTVDKTPSRFAGGSGGVDMRRLLELGDYASGGCVDRILPLLEMDVGMTGVSYHAEGEEHKDMCSILHVRFLLNVNFMGLIVDKLLAPPKAGCSNFETLNKRRNELLDMFESLLIDQHALISKENTPLRPSNFFGNPNGVQGAHTLCNPFLEPLKIIKYVRDHHANPTNVRIIGFPKIDWCGNPDDPGHFKNYLRYMLNYSALVVEWSGRIIDYCKPHPLRSRKRRRQGRDGQGRDGQGRDGQARDGTPQQQEDQSEAGSEDVDPWSVEHTIGIIPGWPKAKTFKYYYQWATSCCPILMRFRNMRERSVNQTFACFRINFGGLPEMVTSLMRKFLFFNDDNTDSDKLNAINMRGLDIPWDPSVVKNHFYSDNQESIQLVTSGCKIKMYHDILDYIRESIKAGEMSPHCGVRIFMKHLEMSLATMDAMIENGNYVSHLMTQALEIKKRMFEQSREKEPFLFNALNTFQTHILPSTRVAFVANPFDFARHLLLRCMIGVNDNGQLLNSINLYNKVSHITSMQAYSAGCINSTIDPIGHAAEIAPCCGTAREFVTNGSARVEVVMSDCPNSGGKDFSIEKVNDDHENLMLALKMNEPAKHAINILNNYTETSVLLATCIQVSKGDVLTSLDPQASMEFQGSTEMREEHSANHLNIMIKHILSRGGNVSKSSMTTKDSDGTREAVYRRFVRRLRLVVFCSNQKTNPVAGNEQRLTLQAVTHVIPPGSTPSMPSGDGGSFNDIQRNKFEGRSFPLNETWAKYSAMLAGVQVMSMSFMGQLNDTGFVKCELNPATRAALDFLFIYVQRYYESLFAPSCRKNRFIRLKKVYEFRESAFCCLVKTLQHCMETPDCTGMLTKGMADFMCDPLALTCCGNLFYNMLFRCISWVPCFITRIFIIESGMPVVPTEVLIQLMSMPNPPRPRDVELRRWYEEIQTWLMECLRTCRFCANPNGGGLCEYISSSGLIDGGVEKNGLFRVAKKTNLWAEVGSLAAQQAIADEIWAVYRADLHNSCAMSREALIPGINDMINGFYVDCWKLLGVESNAQRHMDFFNVTQHMQFNAYTPPDNGSSALAIKVAWMRDSKEAASIGIGVNCIQLLLLGSLMGESMDNVMHPQIISDLARALVEQVMIRSPKAMIPTNVIEVNSFNCFSCELQPIVIDTQRKRPDHFLRIEEEQFARTGCMTEIKNFGRFAADDILHMGPICRWLELLDMGDDVKRVPATIPVCYSLEMGKAYCAYNQTSGCLGCIRIDGEAITFEYQDNSSDSGERTGQTLLPLSWHHDLMEAGFVLLPMIRRQGACIAMQGQSDRVGVLVPIDPEEGEADNFCQDDFTYSAKIREGHFQRVCVLDVMDCLMPIGTKLFLKMESHSAGPLLSRLPFVLSQITKPMHALRVFLNSPNVLEPVIGKVYVSLLCTKGRASASETILVDPWELLINLGSRTEITSVGML